MNSAISITIALALAVAITALWISFGGWSQAVSAKMLTSTGSLPGWPAPTARNATHKRPYALARSRSRHFPEIGASIRCPDCLEIALFEKTVADPVFFAYQNQPRVCGHCDERYNGTPESTCPTCRSSAAELAGVNDANP